jgi:hypothetical protein
MQFLLVLHEHSPLKLACKYILQLESRGNVRMSYVRGKSFICRVERGITV